MNADDVIRLSANREAIVQDLDVSLVIDRLVAEGVLCDELEERIRRQDTYRAKARELVRILQRRGPNAYSIFRCALADNYPHLVERLDITNIGKERTKREDVERQTSRSPDARDADVGLPSPVDARDADVGLPSPVDARDADVGIPSPVDARDADVGLPSPVDARDADVGLPSPVDARDADVGLRSPVDVTDTSPRRDVQELPAASLVPLADLPAPLADVPAPLADLPAPLADLPAPLVNYRSINGPIAVIPAISNRVGSVRLKRPTGAVYCPKTIKILVADNTSGRIVQFDLDGSNGRHFVRADDSGCGQYSPYDIAIGCQGDVFATDSDNNRVIRFSRDGNFKASFCGSGDDQLKNARGLACHDGFILVCDDVNERISVFTEDGTPMRHFGSEVLSNPHYVAVGPGDVIYVANDSIGSDGSIIGQVCVFSWEGRFLRRFGEMRGKVGDKSWINAGLIADSEGYVCVVRHFHRCVDVFDPRGSLYTSFGFGALYREVLSGPTGLLLLPDGRVIVCDSSNERLLIF